MRGITNSYVKRKGGKIMSKEKRICVLLIASLLISTVLPANVAQANFETGNLKDEIIWNELDEVPYEYPIQPGTDEWKKFTTVAQMVEVCQIPEKKLKNMTTEALVETVLNYPLLLNSFSHHRLKESLRPEKKT